jgi:hypothetical protein
VVNCLDGPSHDEERLILIIDMHGVLTGPIRTCIRTYRWRVRIGNVPLVSALEQHRGESACMREPRQSIKYRQGHVAFSEMGFHNRIEKARNSVHDLTSNSRVLGKIDPTKASNADTKMCVRYLHRPLLIDSLAVIVRPFPIAIVEKVSQQRYGHEGCAFHSCPEIDIERKRERKNQSST